MIWTALFNDEGLVRVMKETYCTTGQFANYKRHCGPTAMTNLVLAFRPDLEATLVFNEIVAIGRRHLAYLTVKNIGGTSDGLSGVYLRAVLNHYGLGDAVVKFAGVATERRLRRALQLGAVCYLQMHFHPKYHNHHVLVYASDWKGLRTADGWQCRPVFLNERDVRGATFFTIMPGGFN